MARLAVRAAVSTVVAAVVLCATFDPSSAMTRDEALCRKAILKGVAKYVKTGGAAIASCHRQRNAGALAPATDCNDLAIADSNARLVAVESAFRASVGGIDDRCALAPAVLASYPSCKSPAETADDGGATTEIDSFGELADCEIALARELVQSSARQVLGHPDPDLMTSDAAQCHSAIAQSYTKTIDAYIKARGACESRFDKRGGPLNYACDGDDSKAKIAKALAKLDDAIASRCSTLSMTEADAMRSCGDTAAQLENCVTDTVVDRIGSGLASMVYGLSMCPRGVDLTLHAGVGTMLTDTEIDLGSTGFYHDQDVPDESLLALNLDCNPVTCANCNVALDPKKNEPQANCRCQSNPTLHCDTINGNDPDCGGGLCNCYFFPPHPINGGGTPLCLVQKMNSDFTGAVSPAAGQAALNVDLSTVVYLGISQGQPCPICDSDIEENDGISDGTCVGGTRTGLPCDANGRHCTFGDVSYECLPDPLSNVSGAGLQIDFAPLTTGSVSLATPTCGGALDSCVGSCIPDTGSDYRCDSNGPIDSFCADALTCPGDGYIPCTVDADCDALDPTCPNNDCGDCTTSGSRDCPSNPLTASGSAAVATSSGGPFQGEMVSTFCVPSTAALAVNGAGGFPGPGRLKYDLGYDWKCGHCTLDASQACDSNADCNALFLGDCVPSSTSWNPPNGSNCDPGTIVFTTSAVTQGNFGGIAAADNYCAQAAVNAGLPGTFYAWLTDAAVSPSTRFVQSTSPYRLVNGTIVALDWADLTDGSLQNAISRTELDTPVAGDVRVWTGTWIDGTPIGPTCSNWTSTFGVATVGGWAQSDMRWTFSGTLANPNPQSCSAPLGTNSMHFYCFQQ